MTVKPERSSLVLCVGRQEQPTQLTVNGHAISSATTSITIRADAKGNRVATLELALCEIEVDGEMDVVIPRKTRAALIALGWTPPDSAQRPEVDG